MLPLTNRPIYQSMIHVHEWLDHGIQDDPPIEHIRNCHQVLLNIFLAFAEEKTNE